MISLELLKHIQDTVTSTAREASEDAAMGGHMSDGGASRMMENLRFFLDGVTGQVPHQYKGIVKSFNKKKLESEDPEYKEFLRLSTKFNKE